MGEWLPLALADLLVGLASVWGKPGFGRAEALAAWGLRPPEEDRPAGADPEGDRWLEFMLAAGATAAPQTHD